MSKVFTNKDANSPEEYLKSMLSCVDDKGEIAIARYSLDNLAFFTSEEEEDATLIERVRLDKSKIGYDDVLAFYKRVTTSIESGTFSSEFGQLEKEGKFGARVTSFAERLGCLFELKAPAILLDNEGRMLIDSIVLYLGKAS